MLHWDCASSGISSRFHTANKQTATAESTMKAVRSKVHTRLESSHCLPFLYCTRTILRGRPPFERAQGQAIFSTVSYLKRDADGVSKYHVQKFGLDTKEERVNFLKEKWKHKQKERAGSLDSKPLNKNTSTITEKERQIFRTIFNDVSTGSISKKSKVAVVAEQETKSPIDYREIFAIFSNADLDAVAGPQKKIAATAEPGAQQGLSTSKAQQAVPTLSEQDRAHIEKYPTQLRKLASRATLLAKIGPRLGDPGGSTYSQPASQFQWSLEDSKTIPKDLASAERDFTKASAAQKAEIDSVCVQEMKRISEALIWAARADDKTLWAACERLVLPLLALLEDPDGTRASLGAEKQRLSSSSSSTAITDPFFDRNTQVRNRTQPEQPPFHIRPGVPAFPIISTLYPALLLVTLRLLTTLYPFSSYPDCLLHHLRSLGLRPYVLGTSTPFYNTLLLHYWTVYSNLRSMDSLLKEMERGGIEFNAQTVEILERVRADKVKDEKAEKDAIAEEEKNREMLRTLKSSERKKKLKEMERRYGAKGKPQLSAGRRSKWWWESKMTAKWLEIVTVNWKVKIMEKLRGTSGVPAEDAVVEREYSVPAAGKDGGDEGKEAVVWV